MSNPFSRTLRAIESDRSWSWPAATLVLLLLVAWSAWFTFARVPLYATSVAARIEAAAAAHPVDARTHGRVARVLMVLGARVRAGDSLVELESDAERLARDEAAARLQAIQPELAATRTEMDAEERAIRDEHAAAGVAADEQRAVLREAQAALGLARDEASRVARLRASGIIPEVEENRAKTEVERRRAAADAAAAALSRIEQDQRTRESDRRVRIERLRGTVSRLDAEVRTAEATLKRLDYEVERRVLRAPIDGRIAEAADLREGAVVEDGQRVASIVPEGTLRIVAQFAPAAAIGRVHSGQPARVRLEGFPWAEYGTAQAVVTAVAEDVRDGLVRVELGVRSLAATLPITHALPGSVEIEVERIRPVSLVLRTLGGLLTRPVAATAASSPRARS